MSEKQPKSEDKEQSSNSKWRKAVAVGATVLTLFGIAKSQETNPDEGRQTEPIHETAKKGDGIADVIERAKMDDKDKDGIEDGQDSDFRIYGRDEFKKKNPQVQGSALQYPHGYEVGVEYTEEEPQPEAPELR